MSTLNVSCGTLQFQVVLNGTKTAEAVLKALPITANAQRWGEEIYFEIPVGMTNEIPTEEVSIGDVGYWPEGHCFCVFFGRTPASKDDTPKPASAITLIGKTNVSPDLLGKVREGDEVHLSKA